MPALGAWAALLLLPAFATPAPAAREAWSGSYQCGPSSGGAGYSSPVTMLTRDGEALITRESPQIRESMRGRVEADGTLRLEGGGARKEGGPAWLYRFDGRIEGSRFEARGAMLSPNLSSRLRECSMSLTRVGSAGSGLAMSPEPPPIEVMHVAATLAGALTPAPPEMPVKADPGAGAAVERELDVVGKNADATMEGTVARGAPHRYWISAKRAQTLTAALASDGARLDLYEPGATLTLLSGGFVVQGARVGATEDGQRIDLDLPVDGKYLLLVRANGERASYALELKIGRAAPSAAERWLSDERLWIAATIVVIVLGAVLLMRRKRDRRIFRSG